MKDRWVLLARAVAALLVMGGMAEGWRSFGPQISKAYAVWRYPALRGKPLLGADLKKSVDAVRRAEARAQYDRVKSLLDDASGQGLRVTEFYEKLPVAVRMIQAGQFEYARVFLSSIEARIPRKHESILPAGQEAEPDESPPAPQVVRRKPARRAKQ